ncbi:AAA family ATPase [Streptomyces justiciae]|uniref:AAA family ATPase n=1 Tax=Streptomyces justiciae TaxID=2780140 RepID=UPI002AD3349D|nr:hypothetical protein [Streptomyces justiciae]
MKPSHVFDRSSEWGALTAFVNRPLPHAMLGVVSGRWRMGKTYLLRALVEQYGGFYFEAADGTETESLRQFSAALAEYTGSPAAFTFGSWDDAVSYLFGLASPEGGAGPDGPFLAVIDEFPYLTKVAPELPSLIQRAIDHFQVDESRMRLLLCGSAMSVMGGLLASTAPPGGRRPCRPAGFRRLGVPDRAVAVQPPLPRGALPARRGGGHP